MQLGCGICTVQSIVRFALCTSDKGYFRILAIISPERLSVFDSFSLVVGMAEHAKQVFFFVPFCAKYLLGELFCVGYIR